MNATITDSLIIELVERGLNLTQIAQRLTLATSAVRDRLDAMGVRKLAKPTTRKPKRRPNWRTLAYRRKNV